MDRLTPQQQDLVVQHTGLVRKCLASQSRRLPPGIRRRDCGDLFQEAMLGLVQAAIRYQPQQYGSFARYALPYIRGAVCRYLLRQMEGLALPAALARQLVRRQQVDAAAQDAGPDVPPEATLPRFFSTHTSLARLANLSVRRAKAGQPAADPREGNPPAPPRTLHDLYEEVLLEAAGQVMVTPEAPIDRAAIVFAVINDRLRVTVPEYRVSTRSLAKRFGCSPTRVANVERLILGLVRRRLQDLAGRSHEAGTIVYKPTAPTYCEGLAPSAGQAEPAITKPRAKPGRPSAYRAKAIPGIDGSGG